MGLDERLDALCSVIESGCQKRHFVLPILRQAGGQVASAPALHSLLHGF